MMKLLSLTLDNFLAHEHTVLDLSRPLTLVQGANASGKSSIADAIAYALIGRCRSTDRAGRGADKLIRTGATEMSVALSFETSAGSHLLVRSLSGKNGGSVALTAPDGLTVTGKAADARLGLILGADPDLIEATLNMPSWFDLLPSRQSEILSGVLKLRLTMDDVLKEARSFGLSDAAAESLGGGLQRLTAGRETFGPEVLEALYERCFNRRKDAKKELQQLENQKAATPAARIPTANELQAARDRVQQLETELGGLREKIGTLKARSQERTRTLQELAHIQSEVVAAQKEQPKLALQGPPIDELEQQLADLKITEASLAEKLQEAIRAHAELKASTDQKDREISAIEHSEVTCPSIHAPAACPISEGKLGEAKAKLKSLKKVLHDEKARFVAARAAKDAAEKDLSACRGEIDALQTKISNAKQAAAKQAGQTEGLEERLGILQANLDDIGDPAQEIRDSESRIFGLDRDLKDARMSLQTLESAEGLAKARDQILAAHADKADEVAILDELCRALDPKALPARILEGRIGPVVSTINERLSQITDGAYRVSVRADKGLVLDIFKGADANALPVDNLSSSERLRIGIALAATLSGISILDILVIDNADILDQHNRSLLGGSLGDLGTESLVVISTREEPSTTSNEDVAVYWIEEGAACEVLGKQEASAG